MNEERGSRVTASSRKEAVEGRTGGHLRPAALCDHKHEGQHTGSKIPANCYIVFVGQQAHPVEEGTVLVSGDVAEEALHVQQQDSQGREVPLTHRFKERIGIILNYSYCSRDPSIDWMFAKLLQERIRTKGTKRREDGSVNAVLIHSASLQQHTWFQRQATHKK